MDPVPRYCPERELPGHAYTPGRGPHPSTSAADPEPPPSSWDGDEHSLGAQPGYRWGVDLYNHGYYWEAHESWEALWNQATRDTVVRTFLQGLIQCAAAALKATMGQPAACRGIAERGLAKLCAVLASDCGDLYADTDIGAFTTDFHAFVDATPGTATAPKLRLV